MNTVLFVGACFHLPITEVGKRILAMPPIAVPRAKAEAMGNAFVEKLRVLDARQKFLHCFNKIGRG